jgi:hypothetical protein
LHIINDKNPILNELHIMLLLLRIKLILLKMTTILLRPPPPPPKIQFKLFFSIYATCCCLLFLSTELIFSLHDRLISLTGRVGPMQIIIFFI